MKRVSLELNGHFVEGWVAPSAAHGVWVHVGGESFLYEPAKTGARGRKGVGAGSGGRSPGEILAPMPGKIVKVEVRPGDQAAASQVLLVMEAMKMEYTLKAAVAGTVKVVTCAVGDQVALGQKLVSLDCEAVKKSGGP